MNPSYTAFCWVTTLGVKHLTLKVVETLVYVLEGILIQKIFVTPFLTGLVSTECLLGLNWSCVMMSRPVFSDLVITGLFCPGIFFTLVF